MITGRDIVCISSIEWDFLWQGHQEITSRLAGAGNRVLFVENLGVRAPKPSDARRVAHRLGSWWRSRRSRGARQVLPGLFVTSPLALPPFGAGWRRALNRRLFMPAVQRTARELGMTDPLLWTYLPTDTAVDLIRILRTPLSVVVYYCVADWSQLAHDPRRVRATEETVVQDSDLVFAQGPELADHCRQWKREIHTFSSGVSMQAFPGARPDVELPIPQAFQDLRRPIIGYIGGLHRHVDFGLLAASARSRPDWSWVFVGVVQTEIGDLSELPNVHLLGQRPHQELARYVAQFDACIVPYVKSVYTDTVVPTKINEYLAMGKPVVSTELPAVLEFNGEHQVLWTSPWQTDGFVAALEGALRSPRDAATAERRRGIAALGDWQARLEAMSALIEAEYIRKNAARRDRK